MKRIVFLDYLRVLACFMVIVIHSTEPYYLGGEGVAIVLGKIPRLGKLLVG